MRRMKMLKARFPRNITLTFRKIKMKMGKEVMVTIMSLIPDGQVWHSTRTTVKNQEVLAEAITKVPRINQTPRDPAIICGKRNCQTLTKNGKTTKTAATQSPATQATKSTAAFRARPTRFNSSWATTRRTTPFPWTAQKWRMTQLSRAERDLWEPHHLKVLQVSRRRIASPHLKTSAQSWPPRSP